MLSKADLELLALPDEELKARMRAIGPEARALMRAKAKRLHALIEYPTPS